MNRPPRRSYQQEGYEFLSDTLRAFLGDEGGLGKSRQLAEASVGETLVMAPGMVHDGGTWLNDDPDAPGELQKWVDDVDRFTLGAYTSVNLREKTGRQSASGADTYRPSLKLKSEFDREWGTIIFDEAHYLKGRDTYWVQALVALAKKAGRVYLATGTPFPNWAHELFIPLQILYPDEARPGARFGSYWRWVETWFKVTPSKYGGAGARDIGDLLMCGDPLKSPCFKRPPTDPCDHWKEFIGSNLGDCFLMRLRDDVLTELPAATHVTVEVPMTAKQAKAYREMKADYLTHVDDQELVAWSSGSRHVQLDRITTGLGVLATGAPAHPRESGKLQRLEWDLASRSRPTLVVAHYAETVEACVQVARKVGARVDFINGSVPRGAPRTRVVNAFKRGDLDVLVASLETVSEGLNLQVSDQIIFVEKSYKPSRNQQAEWRIHRQGQERPVTVLDYVSVLPGARRGKTVDGNKRELLATKSDRQMRAITAAQFARML